MDNGIYLYGARAAGGVSLGEYNVNVGNLAAGTHYLQLLLEDHGSTSGYAVNITADSFIPVAVPEPGALALFASGIILLIGLRLRSLRANNKLQT